MSLPDPDKFTQKFAVQVKLKAKLQLLLVGIYILRLLSLSGQIFGNDILGECQGA